MNSLKQIRQVFLDMDGTIYHGSQVFPTTLPFLRFLEKHGIGYHFISNNSSYSLPEYVQKLERMGITATVENFYTSTEYCIDYLKAKHPEIKRIFLLGMDSIIPAFKNAGIQIDKENPQGVVIAYDRNLIYDRLCKAAWFLKQGVPGFATHPDVFCPGNQPTWLVDCGAITKALEISTGAKVKVLGKPDPGMLLAAAERCDVAIGECLMAGDRLGTDIAVGRNAGALTCRVVGPGADLTHVEGVIPDYKVENLGELQILWEEALQ